MYTFVMVGGPLGYTLVDFPKFFNTPWEFIPGDLLSALDDSWSIMSSIMTMFTTIRGLLP